NIQFYMIGEWQGKAVEKLQAEATPNVHFLGKLEDRELLDWYQRAKVYVQASLHEAFGCSMAEAMLCECIPVVSRRAALPEVVGDCGYYPSQLEPQELASRICDALQAPPEMGKKARARISGYFPLERRRHELLAAVAALGKS
ncbi:MAG: glycosyltransferase family 4 protein, partial [Candidatus Marsarchaeota archaeon]|nr:glycosyltransferase family 4 protein [Candidatus Marsarchaeota archaeon]